jgi:hypothetical protein
VGRGVALVALLAAATGCLEADTVVCADGRICPQGFVCIDAFDRCGRPDQLTVCATRGEGDPCPIDGVAAAGVCAGGVCLRAGCGDSFVTGSEECDTAGETTISCTALGYYDDGTATCQSDCSWDDSACTGRCGDQVANGAEACDGPDLRDLSCEELGFYRELSAPTCTNICTIDSSGCADYCGDSITNGPEFCDSERPNLDCVDLGGDAGHPTCTGSCTPALASCVRFGWSRVTTTFALTGTSYQLGDIHGSGAGDIWAVGDSVVVRYDGASWSPMTTGIDDTFRRVWAFAPDDVWLLTIDRVVHYDGTAFAPQTVPTGGAVLTDLWGAGPSDLYLSGDGGLLLHYDGASWTPIDTGITSMITAVSGSGPDHVMAVAAGGSVAVLSAGSWTTTSVTGGDALVDIAVIGPGEAIALGGAEGSVVQRGGTWGDVPVGSLSRVWASADGAIAGGVFAGSAYFDGSQWISMTFGGAESFTGLWGTGLSRLYAVGSSGTIFEFDGSFAVDYELTGSATDPWGFADGSGFAAVGDAVHVLAADKEEVPTDPGITGVSGLWGAAVDDLWAVGSAGGLSHWDGGGWTAQTVGSASLLAIDGRSASEIYAVGSGGTILGYDGSWSARTSPVSSSLFGVWVAPNGDLVAVGDNGTIVQGPPTAPSSRGRPTIWSRSRARRRSGCAACGAAARTTSGRSATSF